MFMRQPESQLVTMAAPEASMQRTFSLTIEAEMSPIFTEKVPPNPQHWSCLSIGTEVGPGQFCQQPGGLAAPAQPAEVARVVVGVPPGPSRRPPCGP